MNVETQCIVSLKKNENVTLFNNSYRVETTRLQNWDYSSAAPYFVTICTENCVHFFGRVQDDKMFLNDIGTIVQNEWENKPNIRPDMNITLDEFVVMPNHFHGIVCIGNNEFNTNSTSNNENRFGPQSKNLGSVMRGFKAAVTKQARKIIPGFGWQASFHEHIIREEESYSRIRQYILNNPASWSKDKFYSGQK